MKINVSIMSIALIIYTGSMAAEAWNVKTNFGGQGRHRGTGVSIGNRGYIGLGHYNGAGPNIILSDWWEFDPGTNTWSQKADYPIPTYAAAAFTIGSKCYVGSGVSGGSSFYEFDPFSNTWSPIQNVPAAATDQVAFGIGNRGYYLHGSQLYEYNPELDQWLTKNTAPFSPSSWSSSFTIQDKGYVKTGSSLYEYKSATDSWVYRAPFPGLATGGSAAFAVKGKGYIVCGYIGWLSELSSEVWEFDPATNVWTQLDEFPGIARRFSAGFAIGEKGYVGIGTNGTNFSDFWEFDELLSADQLNPISIEVYPNPANEFLYIENVSGAQAKIYNLGGQVVLHEFVTNSALNIEHLLPGNYILQIQSENQVFTEKLTIL